jgi:hypothetical protein
MTRSRGRVSANSPACLQESIQLVGQICEANGLSENGHDVRVTVVKGGKSVNGFYYDADALRSIAQMVEGARAYADHGRSPADEATRSVRDMVGFYKEAQYVPGDSQATQGRVEATLHIMQAADWLWSLVQEAVNLGRPDLIGLSIDILGIAEHDARLQARKVSRVVALNSCDIVTRPSAGGSFQRILHDEGAGNPMHKPTASGNETEQPEQDEQRPTSDYNDEQPTDQPAFQQIVEQQLQETTRLMNELRIERCAITLERRLLETVLPEAALKRLRSKFAGRIFEESELVAEISAIQGMLAEMTDSGLIRNHGYEKPRSGQMITEAERVQAAFDRMFDLEIDSARFGNIRGFSSIREAYARVTGDASVAGGINNSSILGQIAISEHAPMVRISEADTTTASFSYLLGTSMNKRLLKDYQTWPAEWQKFCVVAPIRDFRQQSRVRLGAFGSLSTVPEDTAYTSITLTDSAAVYVPTKRGNLVTVSRETIVNDDLQAIKQIPTKLAVAVAYTLAEFVYSFLSTNPNIYDGNALFTSGAPHSNLGSSAFSSAAMQSGITAMREQTNFAGKRLGLKPSYLIVPAELEWTAMVATKSAGVPGSANNDINPMLGYVTPIVSPQLTNTSQWFLACDPRTVDTIEIGFVGGQVNPMLFIQDSPLFGLNFTQDVVSYKIRHEYGGAVLDYRGLYRGI